MHFHILGAGSLGLLWAGRLIQAGYPVSLIMRTHEAVEQWQAAGSMLTFEHQGTRQKYLMEATLGSHTEALDYLVVATKAHAVASALAPLVSRLRSDSAVIMLQNGLGSQQQARALCRSSRVLCASVTDGAWLREPGHVVWAGQGTTRIGDEAGGLCPPWLESLKQTTLDWVWEQDIGRVLWQKLAINCAINPFTALYDCLNGEIPARAGAELDALTHELQSLLQSQGYAEQAAELPDVISTVILKTAQNSSSMRQDVHAGRRTEIDYILGHACRAAEKARLEVPAMRHLHARLKTHLAMLGLPGD
ncbi:2-dehydropantoate 2-reductase [Halopseudomonas salina]|uniref:2-dehydropantoate 2-reductase n=1 Tax=Halopseudomonas salina TaxID=1323744 RepID=A0ABQ1NVR6_9GAMM|nr:2-dehydropantoate 2-reductase [Halopseudomonas salina]GGC85818.1 2-dehydropantoate 2-reductase [Halopseudomonas salina]